MQHRFLLVIFWLALLAFTSNAAVLDEFSEQTCTTGVCVQTIYSYQKYYRTSLNQFELIDENFRTQNCAPGYAFCVDQNSFQVHAKQTLDTVKITRNNRNIDFRPLAFVTSTSLPLTAASAQVSGNTITYANVLPELLDIRYTYTWAGLKEEFILNQNVFSALPEQSDVRIDFTLSSDFSITNQGSRVLFSDNNAPQFVLENLYAHDAAGRLTKLVHTTNGNSFQLKVPIRFLRNATYPVVIDPTITFTTTSVIFDGFVSYNGDSNTYTRYRSGVGLPIKAGDDSFLIAGLSLYRGVIEWNTQTLPKNATLQDINLTLYFTKAADSKNENVYIKTMDGNSTTYLDTNSGNQNYYADMANGTELLHAVVNSVGFQSFNLTNATANLFDKRLTQTWWGLGFHTTPEDGTGSTPQHISAANDADVSKRPVLRVTYAPATEAEADAAIEQGIKNALASPTIYAEQQVYTRKTANLQQFGRFDRVAASGAKRWTFNYVSSGESFTNMTNLSTTVFVFEMTNLAAEEIRQQIEQYINATRSL